MRIRSIVRCFIFLSLCLIPPFSASADKSNQEISQMDAARFSERVIAAVKDAESRLGCRIGLSFKDKDRNLSVGYREWDLFHAASTMKVPVMIEVLRQADQGKFSMNDTILVDPIFHSMIDDSTFECDGYAYINSRKGQPETILKLTEKMIEVSDNLATNLLITRCNARKITATARQLGATKTLVLRCVMDIPAYEAGLSNRISPGDLTRLFESIELNQAASPASCHEMKRILLAQEHNSMIPAKLPEEVRVAHKTGAIEGVRHDAGIVYTPFGTYYLALMCDELGDGSAGIQALAELSRQIYDERARLVTKK